MRPHRLQEVGGQVHVAQDLLNYLAVGNCRKQAESTTAVGTGQTINREGAAQTTPRLESASPGRSGRRRWASCGFTTWQWLAPASI
jgi:hypothetical protein